MDPSLLLNLILLFILLVLGTYFSAAEMAFASLNRARVKNMADNGVKRAAMVFKMYEERFDEVISTLLICNNTVAIAAATVSVVLFVQMLGETWGYLVSTFAISAIVIVFTDIFPKSMAKEQPEKVAFFCAPLLRVFMGLLRPINWLLVKCKNSLGVRFISGEEDSSEEEHNLRGQELLFMVEEAEKDGAINEDDSLLISNAIEFNDLTAWDIITPRVNIVGIPHDASVEDIAKLFLESGYSRMPMYEESLDTIKGFVHIRDFLKCTVGDAQSVKSIVAPAVFTVTSAPVTELLRLLQKEKSHMAIVTDEYGGTEGLVTMEDILEQLVGDIWDETDEVIEPIVSLGENKHKVLCNVDAIKLFEYFDVECDCESTTVSGWIMDELRRIPQEGDNFTFKNLQVTVTKAEERRAEECMVEIIADESEH